MELGPSEVYPIMVTVDELIKGRIAQDDRVNFDVTGQLPDGVM